eukprot:scaffold101792_cov15-Tisochrysis_lutea.AAC.1
MAILAGYFDRPAGTPGSRLLLFLLALSSSIFQNQVAGEEGNFLAARQDRSSSSSSRLKDGLALVTDAGNAARTLLAPSTHNDVSKRNAGLDDIQAMSTNAFNFDLDPLSSPTLEYSRKLQSDGSRTACFCHKFSAVGNLNDNCLRERLCFKQ